MLLGGLGILRYSDQLKKKFNTELTEKTEGGQSYFYVLFGILKQGIEMGAVGLEPTETEVEGFTVPCNCHYATPPRGNICWQ